MPRVAPLTVAAMLLASCTSSADTSSEVPAGDRTSAGICAEGFDDVVSAWDDFVPVRTVRVCEAGCDAATLEDGVDLACDGEGDVEVVVGAGVYPEALYLTCPGQRLRLRAEDAPETAEQLRARPESERAILDGGYLAPDDCGEREHGALQIEAARAVSIEGLEIRGYHRACAGGTAYGVVVQGDSAGIEAVRVDACYIHDVGVACPGGATTCDGDLNGHGVLVIGVDDAPIRRVDVSDNALTALSLGQSEALALNGHIERFSVTGNHIWDVDNIGIDVIGFENDLPWQARQGVVRDNDVEDLRCGNPTYASDTENDACPDGVGRWPAAAGIYVDGAHGVCVVDNRVRAFDRGLEVASERGGGDRKASAIALCSNRLEASREHAFSYGGSCGDGSNGARDVRSFANTVVCPEGDDACREVSRDDACTTALECAPVSGCEGPAPEGELLECP